MLLETPCMSTCTVFTATLSATCKEVVSAYGGRVVYLIQEGSARGVSQAVAQASVR